MARGDVDEARSGGEQLAREVLASPLVRLAVEVFQAGEHVDARIVELCEAMLAEEVRAAKRGAA